MKQPDHPKFKKAMQKDWDHHLGNNNFVVVLQSDVPKEAIILQAVLQMKCKHDIQTCKVKKYKAHMNTDRSFMQQGVHYNQTYNPVASWNLICTLLIMMELHGLYTKQIHYMLVFPQAPIEREIYMQIPKGF